MLNETKIKKLELEELKEKLAKETVNLTNNIKIYKEKETIEELFFWTGKIREGIQICEYLEKEVNKIEKEISKLENKGKGGDSIDEHINAK